MNFRSLLESSRSLTNSQFGPSTATANSNTATTNATANPLTTAPHDSLPRIERPLDQLELQSRKLWQKATRSRDGASEARASYLLAGRGFDAERVSQTLQSIQVARAFEPMQPLQDTDVEGYLRNEHQVILVSCIEEARRETIEAYESSFEKSLLMDWDGMKKNIYDSLGHQPAHAMPDKRMDGPSRRQLAAPMYPLAKTMVGMSRNQPEPIQADRLQNYAKVVADVNDARLQKRPLPVVGLFEQVSRKTDAQAVARSWELLAFLIGERSGNVRREPVAGVPSTPPSSQRSSTYTANANIGEREFAQAYLGTDQDAPSAVELRQHLVSGGRRWLEAFFRQYLNDHVARILKQRAGTGESAASKMSMIQKIQLWASEVLRPGVGSSAWEQVDGHSFWAILFYLLRSGCDKEALEYATYYERYLAKTEKRFLDYLATWVTSSDHTLSARQRADLTADFNARIRDGVLRSAPSGLKASHGLMSTMAPPPVDPYKYLVFRILGRIGLEDTSIPQAVVKGLAGSILGWEDDIWFQLMLVRETNATAVATDQSTYTLKDMSSRYLQQYSVNQWTSNGQQPIRYFQILLLCAQFEKAVQFLWNLNQQEVVALHFAVALAYYGLLRVPSEGSTSMEMDIVSSNTKGLPCIHFSRMLQLYTRNMLVRAANPKSSSHYYFLLCLYTDGYLGEGKKNLAAGEVMKQLCHEWLVELLLETGQIDEFLGGLSLSKEDGSRRYGFLDKYLPILGIQGQEEFKRCIIRPAAERAERRAVASSQRAEFASYAQSGGVPTSSSAEAELQQNNAILLYNLAEDYDTVMDILASRVSDGLSQQGLQSSCDQVISAVQGSGSGRRPTAHVLFDHEMERLSRLETMASSVLEYYSMRSQILARVSGDRKRTLSSLVSLLGFYKSVLQVAQEFLRQDVQVYAQGTAAGEGYHVHMGTHTNWSSALAIIEDLGLIPSSGSASMMTGTPASSIDFSRINTKAEQLRREFHEQVLRHLPDVFLGVEMMLVVGWASETGRRETSQQPRMGRDLAGQSRQLLSFVSTVSRWYKISADVRRRLVTMDEFLMH